MKRLLCILTTLAALCGLQAQTTFHSNYGPSLLRSTVLPLLDIVTVDGQEPTYDEVSPPPGGWGRSIANAVKVPAQMTITLGPDTLYDSGPYVEDQSGLTVKVRGNTSAYYDQKPLKLKLEKKADLLMRNGSTDYRDKHWVLLADPTFNTVTGFMLSRLMQMEWTPAWQFVNVRLNGQYRGLYVLCEQVRRNADCRINVDSTTGFIIEHDAYWWNEPVWFQSTCGRKYTFKYPESEDVTQTQVDYINGVVSAYEESIADGSYPQHIDVTSFARWLLCHDLLGTYDSSGANCYIARQDDHLGTRLRMPCLWDFGSSFYSQFKWSRLHTDSYTVFPSLLENVNPEFTLAYRELWADVAPAALSGLDEWLAGYEDTELLSSIERSRSWTMRVYNGYMIIASEEVSNVRRWFRLRKTWMDNAVSEMSVNVGVSGLVQERENDAPAYDLLGRRVDSSTRGLLIQQGRVLLQR